MQVNILEAKRIIWQGRAKEMTLPAEDGEVCILDFHQSFLMRLRKGDIRVSVIGSRLSVERRTPNTEHRVPIKDGIAFMRGNELTVFIES